MTRTTLVLTLFVAGWLTLSMAGTAAAADGQEAVVASGSFLDSSGAAYLGACIGAGLVIIGGAKGISRVGGGAVESMARQPEVKGDINVAMIITAAMIEGATLFAVVVCLLAVLK